MAVFATVLAYLTKSQKARNSHPLPRAAAWDQYGLVRRHFACIYDAQNMNCYKPSARLLRPFGAKTKS